MSKVQRLPQKVAERIAAGEVVERPASALKEMLENSLDAGATSITVRVEAGGKKLLEVSDDGCGMSREDALLALERFTTSKIADMGDLDNIITYGFRGEALPSIATVSRMEICTSPRDSVGSRILIEGAEITLVEDWEGEAGTRIRVRSLFYNLPARLKFMQSDSRELSRCLEVYAGVALAAPSVKFRFASGKRWLSTLVPTELEERIPELVGRELAGNILHFAAVDDEVSISGFISPPDLTRPHSGDIFFLINRRAVSSRPLFRALVRGYGSHLLPRRYPVAVIALDIPPHWVDPNVHPRKEEVRITHEKPITQQLEQLVRSTLDQHHPELSTDRRYDSQLMDEVLGSAEITSARDETPSVSAVVFPPIISQPPIKPQLFVPEQQSIQPQKNDTDEVPASTEIMGDVMFGDEGWGKVLGVFDDTYILVEHNQTLSIIDQHAAHERILYEELKMLEGDSFPAQKLLVPLPIELPPQLLDIACERMEEIAEMGFEAEPFGEVTMLLRSISTLVARGREETTYKELLDELLRSDRVEGLEHREKQLIRLACVGAVKAGDVLEIGEIEALLDKLAATDYPNICPHGRPIVIELRREELERRFRRS